MVMKVGNIHHVLFKANPAITNPDERKTLHPQIKELSSITPTYAVQTPQKFQTLGITELPNGLKIFNVSVSNFFIISQYTLSKHGI